MKKMDLAERYQELIRDLRILKKDEVWHQRAIHYLLYPIQQRFLHDYVTTIGRTIYVTPDWETRALEDRYATIRHEIVHLRQFRRYGLIPMAIAYLLLPFPLGFAWCRMRLEREAYEETIRVHHELGTLDEGLREHILRQFTSGSYGWMWPFPRAVARWYDAFIDELESIP